MPKCTGRPSYGRGTGNPGDVSPHGITVAVRRGDRNGAITVVVSHRFSTVRMADLIVVVDQGRILDSGNHEELMQRRGLYAELYTLQAKAYR